MKKLRKEIGEEFETLLDELQNAQNTHTTARVRLKYPTCSKEYQEGLVARSGERIFKSRHDLSGILSRLLDMVEDAHETVDFMYGLAQKARAEAANGPGTVSIATYQLACARVLELLKENNQLRMGVEELAGCVQDLKERNEGLLEGQRIWRTQGQEFGRAFGEMMRRVEKWVVVGKKIRSIESMRRLILEHDPWARPHPSARARVDGNWGEVCKLAEELLEEWEEHLEGVG